MCQNPSPSSGPSPNGLPSPSSLKGSREGKGQAQVQELALLLAMRDEALRIQAAQDIRKIVRGSPKRRSSFAVPAIIHPLLSMLRAADHASREAALLALLNMAVRNEQNKKKIVSGGAVPLLVEILSADASLRELATAAILTLSSSLSNKSTIAASGAIPLLVDILISGSIQGRVDAITALYNLSNCDEFAGDFFLSSGAVRPLLALLKDSKKCSNFADKATALLSILSESEAGRSAISEVNGGILAIVETIEEGSSCSAENAAGILLSLCRSSREKYRDLILSEGPIPGLLLLTVDGTAKASSRARELLELLRHDSQSKESAPDKADTFVSSIHNLVLRNMEESISKLQLSRAAGIS